jgi:hypothetical protein
MNIFNVYQQRGRRSDFTTECWHDRVKKLAIALASKDNTMAKRRIYLRRNSE